MVKRIHKRVKLRFVICALIVACSSYFCSGQDLPNTQATAPRAPFVLEMSWAPGLCIPGEHIHAGPGSPDECYSTTLSVRGLSAGKNCANTSTTKADKNIKDSWTVTGLYDAEAVEAEWRFHGACSGLTQAEFFCGIEKAFSQVVVPDELITLRSPWRTSLNALDGSFAQASNAPSGSIKTGCTNGDKFTTVWACFGSDFKFTPCGGPFVTGCNSSEMVVTPTEEESPTSDNKQYKPPFGDCAALLSGGKRRDANSEQNADSDNVPSPETINQVRAEYRLAISQIEEVFFVDIQRLKLVEPKSQSPSMHLFQSVRYYEASALGAALLKAKKDLITAMSETRLFGMADYVTAKMPTLNQKETSAGLVPQNTGDELIQKSKAFFYSLRKVEPSLTVKILLTSDPQQGAAFAFSTSVTDKFPRAFTNQTTTLYRGLYNYAVYRRGFKGFADSLDLVDQPTTHVQCELKPEGGADDTICRPLEK